MKLAIIGQTLNKNHASKISGGIQTVERLHVRIFLEAGWDVYFIAPSCSEEFNQNDHFHLCKCTLPAQDMAGELQRADKARHSRTLAGEIRDWINEIQPDLVINHSFSSAHVRVSAELSSRMPVLNFIHNTPDTAMDIGVIAKVQHYLQMTRNGSKLVCVSGYQRDLWRRALRKRHLGGTSFDFISETEIDQVYDKFCYPIFIEQNEVKDADSVPHFICISRPDPIKNVSKLLELCDGSRHHLHLFLAHPGNLDDNEYFYEKIKPHLSKQNVTLHHNAPRQELLDCLSTAAGCFIPCTVEAAPVAFLEAASYGVRSIVFAKERDGVLDHAACHLLGRENLVLINVSEKAPIAAENLRAEIHALEACDGDRVKLRDETYKRHSFQQRSDDLLTIAAGVMQTYGAQPKQKSLLSFD